MGTQNPSSGINLRINWTPATQSYFVDLMLEQMQKGNRVGHTFSKKAWIEMLNMFNAKFGLQYNEDVLKNHYATLWKQFNDINILLGQSGFSWDESRQMVIADHHVWEGYIKAHPDARSYRAKAVLNFDELCLIYAHTTADGRYSRSSHDIDFDDDAQEENFGSLVPSRRERSKADWTPPMDQYFIELMLDQLEKGNKGKTTFNKQAWTDMIALFNAKFGSQHGKKDLRDRHKKFEKFYSDITLMLEQNGFSWDERRQIIAASAEVWDNYIKVHPHAVTYRKQTLPNYQDLGFIYGSSITDGVYGCLRQDKDLEDGFFDTMAGEVKEFLTTTNSNQTYWTVQMDRFFIDILLDQVVRGNKIGPVFITQAWIEMATLFNVQFESHHDKDSLKKRYKHLRRQYNEVTLLLEQSGFSWDDKREMVTAEGYVWDSYTKAHPDAQSYRTVIVPSYPKLCIIFGQGISSEKYNHLSRSVGLNGEVPSMVVGEERIQSDANNEGLGTDWTPSMDRYFIDLMLEQVRKGNKTDTFNTQAWVDMAALFNERFGSQHDNGFFRSRHQSLRKLYIDMKNLLDHSGFSWDESKQMVIANDHLWRVYIREHPDVKPFRSQTKPSYNDLCIIYGNCDSAERCNQPDQDMGFHDDGRSIEALGNGNHLKNEWTPSMDRYFIDIMLEQVRSGSMVAHQFSKQAWADMVSKFQTNFGSQYDKVVLKGRFKILRKRFNNMKNILDQSGFSWDEMQQMITVDDDNLWDSYIKEYPEARSYRTRALPNYNDLFLIYGNATTNVGNKHPSDVIDADDDTVEANMDEDDEVSAASGDPLRIGWTKAMHRYFIYIILEQVRSGNKINHTFDDETWGFMVTSFNEKFGLQCSKYLLENRYFGLMKEYNDICDMLNEYGFVWDESQQRITADDDVWEAYIKEHPDEITFRYRPLEYHTHLHAIFGSNNFTKTRANGVSSHPQSSERRKKRQSEASATPSCSRKSHKTGNGRMQETVVSSVIAKDRKNITSIESIVDALQTIPDIEDEVLLEACNLFDDEKKAKTFLALDVTQREKWLLRKLRKVS